MQAPVVIEQVGLETLGTREQDHAEGAERHQHVDQRVVERRRVAVGRPGHEAEHDEAHVGDGRVGEHALQVALHDRDHVADHEGEHRERREHLHPLARGAGEALREQPQSEREVGDLRRGADEERHAGRGSLVHVRKPHVKGHGAELEGHGHHDEGEPQDHARGVRRPEPRGDLREIERAGEPVDQRHAVQQRPGGDGAEHEILHGRLGADARVAVEGHHRVHRQREQLHPEVDGHEASGGHQHEDAEERREREHVVLAAQDAAVLEIRARIQERHRDQEEPGELQHETELIGHVHAREQRGALRDVAVAHRERGPHRESEQRQRRGDPASAFAREHVDEQDEADRRRERDLRHGGRDARPGEDYVVHGA